MKRFSSWMFALVVFLMVPAGLVFSADSKAPAKGADTLTCVGLYSETGGGNVSYRIIGKPDWIIVKLGDVLPANAEIRINVDRDWIEVRPTNNLNAVYEITGSDTGEVVKKVADILKGKPRPVAFPVGSAGKSDPKFKDKLVVSQSLGRLIYINADGDSNDIKYGDVLDIKGKVKIIATNNTVTLLNASNGSTTVVGPLNFTIEQVLTNKNLYKYLNVQK